MSDLGSQFVQQRLVRVGVDLALQQLLGAAHGQQGDLLAQLLAGTVGRSLDLGLGQRLLAGGLDHGFLAGRVDDLVGARVGLVDDLVGLGAGFLQQLVDLVLRLREVLLAAVGSRQALGDLLLALLEGLQQRRPDLGGDQPDQACKGQRLGEKSQIEVNWYALPVLREPATRAPRGCLHAAAGSSEADRRQTRRIVRSDSYGARPPTRNGLAKANSRPTATEMMNAASIRPAVMNMRTCRTGISSGWRAADSRNLPAMMARPRPAPSAARPIMMPMARTVEAWTEARAVSAVSMVFSGTDS